MPDSTGRVRKAVGVVAFGALMVGLVASIWLGLAAWHRMQSFGCVFMPEAAVVPEDSETFYFVELSSETGKACEVYAGARLVRVDREEGYVLVRLDIPPRETKYYYECPDGTLVAMTESAFWSYVARFKEDYESRSHGRNLREADRRLRQGK